jgi:hypothetical protein
VELEGSGRSRSHMPCGVGVGVVDIRATLHNPTRSLLHVRLQSGRRNLARVATQTSSGRRPFDKRGRI